MGGAERMGGGVTDGHDREFGEVRAKVDALAESFVDFRTEMRTTLAALRADVTGRLNDHSRRLSGLERWRSYIAGGIAVMAAVMMFGKWLVSILWVGGGR